MYSLPDRDRACERRRGRQGLWLGVAREFVASLFSRNSGCAPVRPSDPFLHIPRSHRGPHETVPPADAIISLSLASEAKHEPKRAGRMVHCEWIRRDDLRERQH